uniref:Uncharacterized protein n=1 Tax=Candidatus Kentrum eta TaxID=2126337 RepID=A0A450UBR3_9GAMM|nr:MAG: hypothetical protein BECKH772A_GA0070896_1000539 [Candidatus Kentron sp. H]VFJ89575.1 MAG: hypothetical protein BECKH772B_GA0070898_1000539 [Candidatus Kentron sp. H]VFJ96275.1 MAG: hypothetical protein BECKH772C_GA0070978_1000539 [Candidatus Kentron sp. H]
MWGIIPRRISGSSNKALKPAEARRLSDRLEIHYTPKQGSRLDIVQIESSVSTKQCLGRRIPDIGTLRSLGRPAQAPVGKYSRPQSPDKCQMNLSYSAT